MSTPYRFVGEADEVLFEEREPMKVKVEPSQSGDGYYWAVLVGDSENEVYADGEEATRSEACRKARLNAAELRDRSEGR